MFLEHLLNKNKNFIDVVLEFHRRNEILPDTYCIDLDTFLENSKKILEEANKYDIKLYYMLKQVGRNPFLAKELEKMGYLGAVCVDFKEVEIMMKNNLKISHVGHLVQMPKAMLEKVILYGVEIITVYSLEMMEEISKISKKHNKVQKIMLKIVDEDSKIYPGQESGFTLKDIEKNISKMKEMENIKIDGLTSFPCFLYSDITKKIEKTPNLNAIYEVKKFLENENIILNQINLPSATSVENMKYIKGFGGTHGEPGHALSGTCPINKEEIPAYLYLSEISHTYDGKSYFYGGGYYARGNMKKIYINEKVLDVDDFRSDNIDYYLSLNGKFNVFTPVILCFRTQVFVTRSDVVIISGIKSGNPKIYGRYTSLGDRKD